MRREKCFVIITFILTTILTDQSVGNEKYNAFQKKMLSLHNKYRKMHGVNPLKLDKQMCTDAECLATAIAENSNGLPYFPYGRNVFSRFTLQNRTPIKITPDLVASEWYNQMNIYDFSVSATEDNPTPKELDFSILAQTMEFTQMIWKATEKIGVGMATHNGMSVLVVTYDPPGNTTNYGDYANNVPQLIKPQN